MDELDNDLLLPNDEGGESDELYKRLEIKADKGQEPLRIDRFLMNRIEGATRNKIQQAIHAGLITVDGQLVKPNFRIKPGHVMVVYSEDHPDSSEIIPQDIPLDIEYEDEHVLLVNKKPGMVVHPGVGNPDGTLVNAAAFRLLSQQPHLSEFELPRFGLVHRIDKNTSGLILMAKTDLALQHLAKQFFHHTIERKYLALVWGNVEADSGTITAHIGRSQRHRKRFEAYPDGETGKHAVTHYRVLERFHYVTLVECVLETGRTHQIRVHMKHIGHTLFGDELYGGDAILKGTIYTKYKQFVDNCFKICPRQALHATTLGFEHPATRQPMLFEAPMPTDMQQLVEKWRRYYTAKGKMEDV